MDPETNAAGAPGDDQTSALSLDDAVAKLNEGDEARQPDPKPEAADNPVSEAPEGDGEDDPVDETEPQSEDDPPEGDEPEGEPEAAQASEQEVHGNTKVRLRDGTVVTVGDLKKAYGEFQEERRSGETAKASIRQRETQLNELLPIAMELARSAIPADPDRSLRETDPIEYHNRRDERQEAIAAYNRLAQAQQAEVHRQQEEHGKRVREYAESERVQLVSVLPELNDPQKATALYRDMVEYAPHYKLTKEDIDGNLDHRMVRVLKDAISHLKTQAAKPKAMEKVKDAPPVQSPGRRRAPAERRATEVSELSARLTRTGSLDDAAALLDRLD